MYEVTHVDVLLKMPSNISNKVTVNYEVGYILNFAIENANTKELLGLWRICPEDMPQ